ncbi:MAG: site-specific integrase [Nibricoccus sp.]
MKTTTAERKIAFQKVGTNLYRLESTGGYYALLKRADKQFRRSLKTKDRKLAERRLTELREKVGGLTTTDEARVSFEDLAQRWLSLSKPLMKPKAWLRKESCVKGITPCFAGSLARNITAAQCERWLTGRGVELSPSSFVQELAAMKNIFEYAIAQGIMLSNPARGIKRRKLVKSPIVIPSREQFRQLVEAIRESDGRARSKELAKPGADLVELLAYSGCRLGEAVSLKWSDVDFEKNGLRVTGGETGTKNQEERTIPMTQALRTLLLRLRDERKPQPSEFVSQIDSAKKSLQTTCRRLEFPNFTHHDFRHFFATTCIESGVDIPTVSRWLGHKDGGALAMRVYGHLRQEHSSQMATKVSF